MKCHIIEAENNSAGGLNWGKFLCAQFEEAEWAYQSAVSLAPLLVGRGWTPGHLLVVDLETGEGALFLPGGLASADLEKHRVWVCPLFEPFLEWLYANFDGDVATLPRLVKINSSRSALSGYRRPGPPTGARADRSQPA